MHMEFSGRGKIERCSIDWQRSRPELILSFTRDIATVLHYVFKLGFSQTTALPFCMLPKQIQVRSLRELMLRSCLYPSQSHTHLIHSSGPHSSRPKPIPTRWSSLLHREQSAGPDVHHCLLAHRPHFPPWQLQWLLSGYLGQEQKFGHKYLQEWSEQNVE